MLLFRAQYRYASPIETYAQLCGSRKRDKVCRRVSPKRGAWWTALLCAQLVTFDNGVVAAPVKENTGRRLRTAVDLISLRVGKSRWGLRWEGKG